MFFTRKKDRRSSYKHFTNALSSEGQTKRNWLAKQIWKNNALYDKNMHHIVRSFFRAIQRFNKHSCKIYSEQLHQQSHISSKEKNKLYKCNKDLKTIQNYGKRIMVGNENILHFFKMHKYDKKIYMVKKGITDKDVENLDNLFAKYNINFHKISKDLMMPEADAMYKINPLHVIKDDLDYSNFPSSSDKEDQHSDNHGRSHSHRSRSRSRSTADRSTRRN